MGHHISKMLHSNSSISHERSLSSGVKCNKNSCLMSFLKRPMRFKLSSKLVVNLSLHCWGFPTNTPSVFHVGATWKRLFPRRFNVEHTLCVFRVRSHSKLTPLQKWHSSNPPPSPLSPFVTIFSDPLACMSPLEKWQTFLPKGKL